MSGARPGRGGPDIAGVGHGRRWDRGEVGDSRRWSTRLRRAPSCVVGADPEQVEADLLADRVQDPTEVPRGKVLPQGVRPDRAVRRPTQAHQPPARWTTSPA